MMEIHGGSFTHDSEIVEMYTATNTVTRVTTYHTAFCDDLEDYWTDKL